MNSIHTLDDFSEESQKNSRTSGNYHKIAKNAERKKCVFCDLKEKYIVRKDKYNTLTVNIFPYIDGQLLIIPYRHIEEFNALSEEEVLSTHSLLKLGMKLLKSSTKHKDFWIIARDGRVAGKTIKHYHTNILPYIEALNTWHYQKITIAPVELAANLRKLL